MDPKPMSEEITKDLNPKNKKAKMGRNQSMAVCFIALPVVMSFAAMWFDKMTGVEWYDKTTVFVQWGLFIALGASGGIKIATALRGLK